MTCWRRLLDWTDAGVRQRLHEVLLGKLRAAEQLNISRAVIDGTHIRALRVPKTGQSPVDRRKPLSASPSTDCTAIVGPPNSSPRPGGRVGRYQAVTERGTAVEHGPTVAYPDKQTTVAQRAQVLVDRSWRDAEAGREFGG